MTKVGITIAMDGAGPTTFSFEVGTIDHAFIARNGKNATINCSENKLVISNTSHYWTTVVANVDQSGTPVLKVTVINTNGSSNFFPLGNENLGAHVRANESRTFVYIKDDLKTDEVKDIDYSEFLPLKLIHSK